jgi:hypothetical protein
MGLQVRIGGRYRRRDGVIVNIDTTGFGTYPFLDSENCESYRIDGRWRHDLDSHSLDLVEELLNEPAPLSNAPNEVSHAMPMDWGDEIPEIGRSQLLAVDIDLTLIEPVGPLAQARLEEGVSVPAPDVVNIDGIYYRKLEANIYTVRRFAASPGVEVLFWSAGGVAWARRVVAALGLSNLAAGYSKKPDWLLDDRADFGFANDANKWIDARPRPSVPTKQGTCTFIDDEEGAA